MSVWLSGANRAAGIGRSIGENAARRQRTAITHQMTKTAFDFWTGLWIGQHRRKRSKSK